MCIKTEHRVAERTAIVTDFIEVIRRIASGRTAALYVALGLGGVRDFDGVRVNGKAHIGRGTFLGNGAVVRECVEAREGCIICMGQRILADPEARSKIQSVRFQ